MKVVIVNRYGFNTESLQDLVTNLSEILSCKLELHDSSYKGEYWLYKDPDDSQFIRVELSYNQDPMYDSESDPPEEYYFDFRNKECDFLLYLSGPESWMEQVQPLISKLPGSKLISTKQRAWSET